MMVSRKKNYSICNVTLLILLMRELSDRAEFYYTLIILQSFTQMQKNNDFSFFFFFSKTTSLTLSIVYVVVRSCSPVPFYFIFLQGIRCKAQFQINK